MRRRDEAVIGPARQHVADIEDEAAGEGRRVDPVAASRPHLQAALKILRENGDDAVIGVRRRAELTLRRVGGVRRVVQQPQERRRLREVVVEGAALHAEPERDHADEPPRGGIERVDIGGDGGAEEGKPVRPLVRPLQGLARQEIGIVGRELVHEHQGFAEIGLRHPRDARGHDGRGRKAHIAAMELVDGDGALALGR